MYPRIVFLISLCVLLFSAGCNRQPADQPAAPATAEPAKPAEDPVVRREGEPDVISVDNEDAEMNAAIAQARQTTDTFLQALSAPKPNQTDFSAKRPYLTKDGSSSEHIWISHLSYDGKLLHGTVADEPVDILNLKFDEEVAFPPEELSDWMYMEDGKAVGGRTVRVLRKQMSPAEGAEFDRTLQFKQ